MSVYEYKTLALPRLLKGPRARRQSAADFVSGVIEETLNRQDEQGWEYLGVQEFSTPDRSGLFGRIEAAPYAVLIFRRPRESSEARRRMKEMRDPTLAAASAPPSPARPAAASAPPATLASPPPVTPFPPRSSVGAPNLRGPAAPATPAAPTVPGAPGTPRLDDDFGRI